MNVTVYQQIGEVTRTTEFHQILAFEVGPSGELNLTDMEGCRTATFAAGAWHQCEKAPTDRLAE
ncbi:hypothetical protein HMPREF2998_00580 [Corynebacterium sp. HMSC065A05]|uniref:hypothetical protein n=1 Tax=Corynebacterium sp. HMSC065A05 TaxID=1739502 RepID=UPI0008A5A1E8|nr:hypothetical protein [Corynebacterium sp. HMSC065A05]OFP16014.1 hypothetical protein HMPREF2998_00580 [Corynebacterium sp. HMSC065A05]